MTDTREQTPMEKNKSACERGYGTEHLPDDVRHSIYNAAYVAGHSDGIDEVTNFYGDFAKVALAAYDAATAEREVLKRALEDALSISQTVNHYEGVKAACKRVGLTIDGHDNFTWSKVEVKL